MDEVTRDIGVRAVVIGNRGGEECFRCAIGAPLVAGGGARFERLPCRCDAAPRAGDGADAGDDRPRGLGLGWSGQLLKFLIEEFVVILVPPQEHDGCENGANEAKEAKHLLHGVPPARPPP